MPKGNLTKEEKEKIAQATKTLGDLGFEVKEVLPYDPKNPDTDRRKAKDRRKPAESKKSDDGWDFLK